MKKKLFIFFGFIGLATISYGQGTFSGDLELRNDYYVKDSTIGASGTNHYEDLKSSIDGWFSTNYRNEDIGFDAGIRLDMFLNSRLHNPNQDAYSSINIGNWFVRKKIGDLTLTGGNFYDQFGSGLAFRAYEDRFLGIDNSIMGLHAKYNVKDFLTIKAFGGLRKNRSELYKSFIKGINVEGYWKLGEKVIIRPGISALNRTIDKNTMNEMAAIINGYNVEDRFVPKYNTYVFSGYNAIDIGRVNWYIEGAYKTKEAIVVDAFSPYQNKAGNALYTTLSYSQKGFGITGQFKRIDNFQLRTSPVDDETIINGAINFIPPINKQNSLRLPARYSPFAGELEETSASLDFTYTPKRGHTVSFSFSEIHTNDLNFETYASNTLFRDIYMDYSWKISKKIKTLQGFHFAQYNQDFFEGPANLSTSVFAYSPFFELTHKIDRKKSLRYELQYQHAKKDFGQWVYGLVEFNIAPKFSFSVSDMWNFKPGPNKSSKDKHYYSVFMSYTEKQHRFSIAYVKQVQGIVCTGGVCRLEPAFNGVRLGLNTSF